jgi:uncharacterized protein YfbU (UPF0304 family)
MLVETVVVGSTSSGCSRWDFIKRTGDLMGKIDTLSDAERLILSNQYQILEKVDPDNAKDYAQSRRTVEEGFAAFYGDLFLAIDDELSPSECRYVFDVLDMYRMLNRSYDQLPDKSGIDADDLKFPGFDGNNETRLLSLAEYLRDRDRYTDLLLKDVDLNSHSMTKDLYQNMLLKYEDKKARLLSKQEVIEIIS